MSNKSKFLQFFRIWRKWRFVQNLKANYQAFLESQRLRMAGTFDGLPQLALLAIVCGLFSGAIIILFRWLVEGGLSLFLGDETEGFENLSVLTRFMLVLVGSFLIGLAFSFLAPKERQVGVVHVIERLAYHQGYLPIKNWAAQFLGAMFSLIAGQSVGREGPGIHLGATSGSLIGRYLKVPNNSTRTLVGCGVAAAIAAGFNTPLAGVIFAMEVVLMEYTLIGFTPVIIAAVTATTLSRYVFGDSPAFNVPAFEWTSIGELPYVALLGAVIGCLSAFFTHSTLFMSSLMLNRPYWLRTTLAGFIVGVIAIFVPEVMGIGYDTVNAVLLGQISILSLIVLIFAKCIATSVALGLGIPGGLIGPNLLIGACAGSVMALIGQQFVPDLAYSGFYAMLGMGAMMGATLQAPLAALMALLELTANQSIILPGMIAIISAVLAERVIFKKPSIYRLLMMARGLDYRNNPMAQALRRIGVASVMERNIIQQAKIISIDKAENILRFEPRWIAVLTENGQVSLVPANDLLNHIKELKEDPEQTEDIMEHEVNLLQFPAVRRVASRITTIDTLQEAYDAMQREDVDTLFVSGAHGKTQDKIYGVITKEHIERSYRQTN